MKRGGDGRRSAGRMPQTGGRSETPEPATPRRSRTVLAVDPGSRRIGVAISDPAASVALPLTVIDRKPGWLDRLAAIVEEREVAEVVVGLPKRLDGTEGPAAREARSLAEAVAARTGLPVRLVDERLTTVAADRALLEMGRRAPQRRRMVDERAAALLLQSYLDGAGAS